MLVRQGIKPTIVTFFFFFKISIISICTNWKITFLSIFLNEGSSPSHLIKLQHTYTEE